MKRVVYQVNLVVLVWLSVISNSFAEPPGYLKLIDARSSSVAPKKGTSPVVIAVIDDGVRSTHEIIQPFLWSNPKELPGNGIDDDGNGRVDDIHGWDIADDDNLPAPPDLDSYSHGTHLAGIIAETAYAVAGDSADSIIRIMPVKVISDAADSTYLMEAFAGIEYAVNAGADIILTAWGLGAISTEQKRILDLVQKKGVFLVAAAGNFPEQREQFPAAHPGAFAVASLDDSDEKSINANFGPFVDLSAPGEEIRSASYAGDDAYIVKEGSSAASAMVAAAAALVKAMHPDYSTIEIGACLKNSARPISVKEKDQYGKLGAGKLDVTSAVECNLLGSGLADGATLTNPEGFLRPAPGQTGEVTWLLEPEGIFKGLRFNNLQNHAGEATGTITFRSTEPGKDAETTQQITEVRNLFIPSSKVEITYQPDRRSVRHATPWLMEYHVDTFKFSELYCKGTTQINKEGAIDDGSGEELYSANSSCKWLIKAPPGKQIQFEFVEMDTEKARDLIYFFNGDGTNEKIMAIFSGPNLPPVLKTWGNEVLVWFVTDGERQGKGWKANYWFVDANEPEIGNSDSQ